MNLVQFNNVNKTILGKPLLKDINFSINEKDKIGLIGLNGVGKSTIINMILGKVSKDSGDIFVNSGCIIGYLSQSYIFTDESNTVLEELKDVFKDVEDIDLILSNEVSINKVLNGSELEEISNMKVNMLSGGQKTRVSFAKLLLKNPDILILDEPTNHLDLASIEWLEEYLKKYNKAILLVSHDRVFLDNVCNKIWEIENKTLEKYNGNFSDFVIQKELILSGKIKAYEKQQDKIKKMEEYIQRNRAGRMAKQARGRQTILDRIVREDNPVFNPKNMKLTFEMSNNTSDKVIDIQALCKSYDKNILNDIYFSLYKGEKVGIIGKNGCGKSTLLAIIAGKIQSDSGQVIYPPKTTISYFDQNMDNLNPENTILEEINTNLNYTNQDLRKIAASFLFSENEVDKKIKTLSGGEKVRVSFLKMVQKKSNFLILDEPTNHLDIYSIEVLENALLEFDGSILLVSHNRHFIDSVCNTVYILDENGLQIFKGNYTEYKESLKKVKSVKTDDSKSDYFEKKQRSREISRIEKLIQNYEKQIDDINKEKQILNENIYSGKYNDDYVKLMEAQNKLDYLSDEELKLLELWEKENENLENKKCCNNLKETMC